MKTCQTVQEIFRSIGISANRVSFGLYELIHILPYILCIVSVFLYIICVAETTKQYTQPISLIPVDILILATYLTFKFKSKTFFEIFDEIEQVVNKRLEHPESIAMYDKINQIVEKYCKSIAFFCIYVIGPLTTFPITIHSFFTYFTTDLGTEAFELPIAMWFPFDWRNPIGYSIAICLQLPIVVLVYSDCACVWTFVLSSFLFAITTAKDLKRSLNKFNKNAKTEQTRSHVRQKLTESLQFYSRVKRISDDFSGVCQIPLTGFFVIYSAAICLSLLMIQLDLVQSQNDIDPVMLFGSALFGFAAIIPVFAACEFGQRYSNAFSEVEDVFDQINWYLLPMEMKRILPTIKLYVQQPIEIRFFGSLSCSREHFKRVINSAYSYFMVIRELYQ